MLHRFTERARRVVFHARIEVSRCGATSLEPEHLLLGLLHVGDGLACRVLARTVDSVEQLRREVAGRLPSGDPVPVVEEVPFSPTAMHVLRAAEQEADTQMQEGIGTEHLLLGLLRHGRSHVAQLLHAKGVHLEAVRQVVVVSRGSGEPPGPPPSPANAYRWPQIPFVPSRTMHIFYSGSPAGQPPALNQAGRSFGAYGFTLEEAVVTAWDGNRWHVDIAAELADSTRFDFLLTLPQEETLAACLGLLRTAIEEEFGLTVVRETRTREVYVVTKMPAPGGTLRRYPEPLPGSGCALMPFAAFMRRLPDAPMFPLDPFTVHSLPFFALARWFEEILGGEVVDRTGLPGIYGFELMAAAATPDAFIQALRDEAGLLVSREPQDRPTLVVRRRAQ